MESEQIVKTEGATPAALLTLAVQQNLDIEKLEKLMGLQERYQANQARMAFLESLSNFQNECPVLEKKKKVAFGNTKYSYAPLGEIAITIKETMHGCGLSHRWEMEDATDKIVCTCIISHIDGHSEKTSMSAAKDASGGKNEIQQRGSTITYLQRYTLIAALGISTADEDVDGRTEPIQNGQKQPLQATSPVKQVNTSLEIKQAQKEKIRPFILEPIEKIKACKSVKELTALYNSMPAPQQAAEHIINYFKRQRQLFKT